MLALGADHEKSSWRLRWRSFGRLGAVVFLHVAHFGSSAALKVAEVDLVAARNHIQQFKEISQASEEALASLNTTHDEYKSTTENQLSASWVCSAPFAHLSLTHVFLPIGATRNPSDQYYERRARARAS